MLGYVGVYFVKFIILYQGKKERPAKTKFMSAKAKLRAVLVNFGFPKKKEKKENMWALVSQRYLILKSFTQRSVRLRRVWLRAVLARAESDSAQCWPAQSLTPRSAGLCRVTYFANISAEMNLSAKHFSLLIRGPGGLVSYREIIPKSLVTLPL